MTSAGWFLFVGVVLLCMAFWSVKIERLPLTTAMFYLAAGLLLGPMAFSGFRFNPLEQVAALELLAEVGVLISLFAAGLKLAAPVGNRIWWLPFRLATVSMAITVGLTAVAGMVLLDLSLGAAVLLGAVLAPTDPVLATDVQVRKPGDDDRLRFALTGEAGINDGMAFPFVMLGLGLMGLHDLGGQLTRWMAVDVVWATVAGTAIGGALGGAAGWLTHRLSLRKALNRFTEDLLGLGLIAMAYGLALLLHSYGFLAVFAASFIFHRVEIRLAELASDQRPTEPAPPCMAPITLVFIERLERLLEVALIIVIGGMFYIDSWQLAYIALALLLLVVIRPIAVFVGLAGSGESWFRQTTIAWFGVRGIGSLYYLTYAIQHGVAEDQAVTLISVVLVVIAMSIVLHGVTVTPFMRAYSRSDARREGANTRDHRGPG